MHDTNATDDEPTASADWRAEYEAQGVEAHPNAGQVADALGVTRQELEHFVEFHPNPQASHILGWAAAGSDAKGLVAAWLAGRRENIDTSDWQTLPMDLRKSCGSRFREGGDS